MNGQSHQRAPNKCFLSFVPWQPQNLKPGRTSLIDICEHLLKGVCEGTIPAKPTVETNIIDVRLNFITLRLAFCQQKKNQSAILKFYLLQNISHAELTHTFEIIMPHWFFVPIRDTHSCQVDLLAYPATCEIFSLFGKLSLIIVHHSLHMHPWNQPIHFCFIQCWETNTQICTCWSGTWAYSLILTALNNYYFLISILSDLK